VILDAVFETVPHPGLDAVGTDYRSAYHGLGDEGKHLSHLHPDGEVGDLQATLEEADHVHHNWEQRYHHQPKRY
jgi:hypothetical protein